MGAINKMQKNFQSWFNKDNNASFLFVTAALGWVLASAAQTVGLAANKDLTKEEKKFLIPQEIADGAVNIGMYALVTTNLMKAAEKMAKPGKHGKPFVKLKNEAGHILDYKTNSSEYAKLGRNLKTGAAILGGVVSTCILTPIVRNAFGAYMKKQSDKNTDEGKAPIPTGTYPVRTQPFFTKTYSFPVFRASSGNMKI